MRIVCLTSERNSLAATAMISGLADALHEAGHRVLVLDPDPRATFVRKTIELPPLGHSLIRAFTDAHLPYEHVLFHCPSSCRGLAMSALAAADMALLPLSSDPTESDAHDAMLRTVAMIERSRGLELPVLIVPTDDSQTARHAQAASFLHGCCHCTVWDENVPSSKPPVAAKTALERLASWMTSRGEVLVQAARAEGRAAA